VRGARRTSGPEGGYPPGLLCGGSHVAGDLLDEIDELVIKTYPIHYGTGMPMFATGLDIQEFARTRCADSATARSGGRTSGSGEPPAALP
jgi:dihydrofolate reductase